MLAEGYFVLSIQIDIVRLPQPADCPSELYKLLKQCWQLKPQNRPSFQEILKQLEKIYEDEFPDQNTMVYEESISITNTTSEGSGRSPNPSQRSLAPKLVFTKDPHYISSASPDQNLSDIKMEQEIDITPKPKVEYGLEESVLSASTEVSSMYTPAPKADSNYHYDQKIAVSDSIMEQ